MNPVTLFAFIVILVAMSLDSYYGYYLPHAHQSRYEHDLGVNRAAMSCNDHGKCLPLVSTCCEGQSCTFNGNLAQPYFYCKDQW
ncbi:hypothetical protein Ddc_14377 [Ditylenchus destructor]|nr:hypothetical protein Ddc_14377 [Ditylenchus destructor]